MGFIREAWNVLKFIKAYAARKKFEINGAIAFSSPANNSNKICIVNSMSLLHQL